MSSMIHIKGVGLPCWAIGAEPKDLLAASQSGVVRQVRVGDIGNWQLSCQDDSC